MKMDYHIILRGNGQSELFYNRRDFIIAINSLALAAAKYNVIILAFCFNDNHFHLIVRCDSQDLKKFMQSFRVSLSRNENREQNTSGFFGARRYSAFEISGEDDLRDAICYCLRNPLHHAISSSVMNYPYSSARLYFSEVNANSSTIITDSLIIKKMLPLNAKLPEGLLMNSEGLILPQSFVNTDIVESLFKNKASYLNSIAQPSRRELDRDKAESISKTKEVSYKDQEVIKFISDYFKTVLKKEKSIKELVAFEKKAIVKYLRNNFQSISATQLSRILFVPLRTVYRWLA